METEREEQVTIGDIAAQFLVENDNDVLEASRALEVAARGDTDLWLAITERLLSMACYDACRAVCRTQRRHIWLAPNYDKGGNGHKIEAHAYSLLDLPLPGGKLLRHATRKEIITAAEFYSKQAKTMNIMAVWFQSIAKRVKSGVVADHLTHEQLSKLKETAAS